MAEILDNKIDLELEKAIDPWLDHMRWRSDFQKWREGRLWQEKKQKRTLAILDIFQNISKPASEEKPSGLNGLRILDLGCGMGGLSTALALEGAKVSSLDFNLAYCEITRLRAKRYGLGLDPVNAGGENLPFAAETFDLVICMDVLEHVQNPEDLMKEVSRVLVPGGLLYFTAINRYAFNDPHYHVKGVNWLPRRFSNFYLKLVKRQKDNSRFTDRQTLNEMHYFRFRDLKPLGQRHGFNQLEELGEIELTRPKFSTGNFKGFKKALTSFLKLLKLLVPTYRFYRAFYKGTYQLMLVKGGDPKLAGKS